MAFIFIIAASLLYLLLIVSFNCHVSSMETNKTFESSDEIQKMKMTKEYIQNINKHVKKTIMSIDGDIIDCVLFHKQPAFDHPLLKGKISMEPPNRMNELHSTDEITDNFQLWNTNGEICPQGTIPIKRLTEEDIFRGQARSAIKSESHEHSVVFTPDGRYFGTKAVLNVWKPRIADRNEFSLSQIWVAAGQSGVDLNTVEAGWHANPRVGGDDRPRFFVFWTADAYHNTGCYNLLCPGFVHTNRRIALGAAISRVSTYGGPQFDVTFQIKKDPNNGNWVLSFGANDEEIGYWPSHLFTHLHDSADSLAFGGEIVNLNTSGIHTTTQMGSGHFSKEQYGKAAFVRILEVFDSENKIISVKDLTVDTESPNCYDLLVGGSSQTLGTYFYFGGPGLGGSCR